MRGLSFVCWLSSALILFTPITVYPASGTSAFEFLKLDASARASGMGGIPGSLSLSSALVNPAILPLVRHETVSFSYFSYLHDTAFHRLGYLRPLSPRSAMSVSFEYVGIAPMTRTIADGSREGYREAGEFSSSDMIAGVSYGRTLTGSLSWGAGLKFVREAIDKKVSTAALGTAGLLFSSPGGTGAVGAGILNIGAQSDGHMPPAGGYISCSRLLLPMVIGAVEGVGYAGGGSEIRTGVECGIDESIVIRLGYRYPFNDAGLGVFPAVNLTAGAGFRFKSFDIDYAWQPYGDLGQTHRFSIEKRI